MAHEENAFSFPESQREWGKFSWVRKKAESMRSPTQACQSRSDIIPRAGRYNYFYFLAQTRPTLGQVNLKRKVPRFWKRIKCSPSTPRQENLKAQQTCTGHFGFVFEETSVGEIFWLSWRYRFEERLRKAPFSWLINVEPLRKPKLFTFVYIITGAH